MKFNITKVYNPKGHNLKKDGTQEIFVVLHIKGKKRLFHTGVCVKPQYWNKNTQSLKNNESNYFINRNIIENVYNEVEMYAKEQSEKGVLSLNSVENAYNETNKATSNLFDLYNEYLNSPNLRPATKTIINTTIKHLKEFRKHIDIEDIDKKFLNDFSKYLFTKKLNKNSVGKYLKNLRTLLNRAIDSGLLDVNKYPFRGFNIPKEDTHLIDKCLSVEEINKIENYNTDDESEIFIKDLYLLGVYSGLRFSDLTSITKDNIIVTGTGENKSTEIIKTQIKTGIQERLPIHLLFGGKGVDIINKYIREDNKPLFKVTNQYANRVLKRIQDKTGIKRKLTFHTSRHSCATQLLLKSNGNYALVQKVLGHQNPKTTLVYAKATQYFLNENLKKIKWD